MKESLTELLALSNHRAISDLHTTLIARVMKVNQKTLDVKPVLNFDAGDGSIEYPVFTQVPPIFPHGGDSYMAMPISVGDYCLLCVSERCFDQWYEGSDFVSPVDIRMHDYSDSFALVGVHNRAGALDIPKLITLIGDMVAKGSWDLTGDVKHTGNTEQKGNQDVTGNVAVTGEVRATVKVAAPILQGVLQGVGGGAAKSDQPLSAKELHAENGASGAVTTQSGQTLTFQDGILVGLS